MQYFYLYVENQIHDLLEAYYLKLKEMHSLVDIRTFERKGKIAVIGDAHGDFSSLASAFQKIPKDAPVVILGDLVDRGENGLLNLLLTVEFSLINRTIYYLRGNHETYLMNMEYGFYEELLVHGLSHLYPEILSVFSVLPYACLCNDRVFMVHGGIPKEAVKIDEIRDLPRGFDDPSDPLIMQLLWNDFDEGILEWRYSERGPGTYIIGNRIVDNFLKDNRVDLIVRGHEIPKAGIYYGFSNHLVTVSSFQNSRVRAKFLMIIFDDKLEFEEISLP